MATINVYELVKQILDETYEELGGTATERDTRIKAALSRLSQTYAGLKLNPGPSYDNAATRFAYIFCYVTSHANLLSDLLNKPAIRELFRQNQFSISCIGGGPGSDVVGIIKRLLKMYDDKEEIPRVQVYLCDREKRWMDSWGDVGMKLPDAIKLNTAACELDVTNPASWGMTKYRRADLFTFVYFLSEVFVYREQATPFFQQLFANAKPGALFAFVDNKDDDFAGWFDEMAIDADFEKLHEYSGERGMPSEEQQTVLSDYIARFGRQTKLKTRVVERVFRKPGNLGK